MLQSFQKAIQKYRSRTLRMLRPLNPVISLVGIKPEEIFRDKGVRLTYKVVPCSTICKYKSKTGTTENI